MVAGLLVLWLALLAAPDQDLHALRERDRFQGAWVVTACFVGKMPVPILDRSETMNFEGDQLIVSRNGVRSPDALTFTLDPTQSPRAIDLKSPGFAARGIYEFEGRRLRICYNARVRPTRFDPEEREQEPYNVLYVLEPN
jgi:uncharacterized protein (TIGR03067 family)